jgi:chemotaxis signal transduction protein
MGKGRATILFNVSIDMNEETPNEIDLRMSKLKEVSSKSNGKTFLTLPGSIAIEYRSNIKGFTIRKLGRIVSISNDDMNSLIKMTDDDMESYITKRFQGEERKQEILKEFIRIVIDEKVTP